MPPGEDHRFAAPDVNLQFFSWSFEVFHAPKSPLWSTFCCLSIPDWEGIDETMRSLHTTEISDFSNREIADDLLCVELFQSIVLNRQDGKIVQSR